MILKDLDFLSPSITLFHYGRRNHSSEFGGILTIFGVIFCFIYILYLLNDLFNYKTLSLLFYNKYEDEAGKYIFDNEGIYHFIQFYNKNNNGYFGKYDKKYIRIFISSIASTYPYNSNLLRETNHWVYDLCEENIDNEKLNKKLFDKIDNFTNSACIKYYYDSRLKKYFNKTNKNFIFPFIEHGNSRKDNTLLGIIIEKCNNNSILNELLGPCGSEKEIKNYLQNYVAFYFSFIDNQVDPTNFKKPIQKYFNKFSGRLSDITYPVNNINFNPLLVKTDKGRLNKKYFYHNSFIFDTNRKDAKNNNDYSQILCEISFWLQNNFIIYDRSYKKILDIFPYIGGVIEITYYCLYIINYLFNSFKILSNTKNLFFKIHTGRELNLDDNEVAEETFVRKFKFMLNKDNNYTIDDFKRRASCDHSILPKKINNFEIIGKNSKKAKIFRNYYSSKNLKVEQINNNYNIDQFNNNCNVCTEKRSRLFSNLNFCNCLNHNKNTKNNKIKENSNNNYIIDNSVNKLKLQNSNNNNFSIFEGDDKSSQQNTNILLLKNRKNNILNLINEKNNTTKDIILSKDIERYNTFKEDLKRYMNENIKKVMCPNRKIEFIEDKLSFIDYLFSLCSNKKIKNTVNILERFRKKLVSEEHLYRAHINLYSLEKYFEVHKKKIDILELYKNL